MMKLNPFCCFLRRSLFDILRFAFELLLALNFTLSNHLDVPGPEWFTSLSFWIDF